MADSPKTLIDLEGDASGVVLDDVDRQKERRLLTGQPWREFRHPVSGKRLPVYPKPLRYLYRIDEAVTQWLIALSRYDQKKQVHWWTWWLPKRWRGIRRRLWLTRTEDALFYLLCLIFEDVRNPENHVELTPEEFLDLPVDLAEEIVAAYIEANDTSRIVNRLISERSKKKAL